MNLTPHDQHSTRDNEDAERNEAAATEMARGCALTFLLFALVLATLIYYGVIG